MRIETFEYGHWPANKYPYQMQFEYRIFIIYYLKDTLLITVS